jgi:hypothetical protein
MDKLIAPYSIKQGIFRCLKAGVSPEFPEQGTPQGGVVSPLLANIALNGIESIHRYHAMSNYRITDKTSKESTDVCYILLPGASLLKHGNSMYDGGLRY